MSISFDIQNDVETMWEGWSNQSYKTVADAITELKDNSIQAGTGKYGVHTSVYTDAQKQRWIVVEDGGSWGSLNPDTLKRCFTYGKPRGTKKTGLNEHNMGLKHVLAYLDKTNNRWKIQIRVGTQVWEIAAPYSQTMDLKRVATYEGTLTSSPSSTYIRVPLDNPQFNTLYERSVHRSEPNEELLINRLRMILERHWMMREDIRKKEIPMFLNAKQLEPYDILHDPNVAYREPVTRMLRLDPSLPEITLTAQSLYLKFSFPRDDPVFRRGIKHSGVYLFKHGRLIQGHLFEEIYGKVADGHYNGFVVLVNMEGDQKGLPSTFTTKNNFTNQDGKLQMLFDVIKDMCPAMSSTDLSEQDLSCEKTLMEEFYTRQKAYRKKDVDKGNVRFYSEHVAELHLHQQPLVCRDKMDLVVVEVPSKTVTIYEGKVSQIKVEDLRQLFTYYRNLKHFCPDYNGYTIETRFLTTVNDKSQAVKDELLMLQQIDSDFTPEIETFEDYGIGRRRA